MGKRKEIGSIVVLSIANKKDVVIRLTKELLTKDVIELLGSGFFKTRPASLLEKRYWFEGYDSGHYGLNMDGFKDWVKYGKA